MRSMPVPATAPIRLQRNSARRLQFHGRCFEHREFAPRASVSADPCCPTAPVRPLRQYLLQLRQRIDFHFHNHLPQRIAGGEIAHEKFSRPPHQFAGEAFTAPSSAAASATWLSLISTASNKPVRWLCPPPRRTAYFSNLRQPGVVLRVSYSRALVPCDCLHKLACLRGDSRQPPHEIQQRAFDSK